MSMKKLLLSAFFLAAIVIIIYICKMLSPLFDDVWKILVAGVPVGFILGFWSGMKWKTFDIEEKKKLHIEKVKLEEDKEEFKESHRL